MTGRVGYSKRRGERFGLARDYHVAWMVLKSRENQFTKRLIYSGGGAYDLRHPFASVAQQAAGAVGGRRATAVRWPDAPNLRSTQDTHESRE
jgi:hypothetical protein